MPRRLTPHLALAALLVPLITACGSGGPSQPTVPHVASAWSLPYEGQQEAVLFGDQLVSAQVDAQRQKDLGLSALNLNTRTLDWHTDQDLLGLNSTVSGDFLITFDSKQTIQVRDHSGTVVRTLLLPDDISGNSFSLYNSRMPVIGNILVLPIGKAVLAYDLNTVLHGTKAQPAPLWRYTPAYQPGNTADMTSASYDSVSGLLFVGDREENPNTLKGTSSLSAIRVQDGSLQWRNKVADNSRFLAVGAGGGQAYVHISGQATVEAYGPDGIQRWMSGNVLCKQQATTVFAYLDYDQGTLFTAPDGDACLGAVDPATGMTKFIFDAPQGGTFGQRPLVLNGVMYGTNQYLWAVDVASGAVLGRSDSLGATQTRNGTLVYDAKRNQMLTWSDQVWAFTPLR